MKRTVILLLSAFSLQLSASAQGPLTPPGAPAPTMKTLAQIEPRTAITNTASAVTINNPGSYYLTGNLTVTSGNAITIATNGVTLDLNGFTISSAAASAAGTAIVFSGPRSDITILNGHIRGGVTNNGSGVYAGSGFANGIYYSGNLPVNVLVSQVSVSGCLTYGINLTLSDATVVEGCTARIIGSDGIAASTVKNCGAADCGGIAIYGDQVSDSRGASTGSGTGLSANAAQNCSGSSSGSGTGIDAITAQNCYGYSFSGTGLSATVASFCVGSQSGGTAIYATVATSCYAVAGTNIITHKYNMP